MASVVDKCPDDRNRGFYAGPFNAASSGTSPILALDGKYANCAIYAQPSTGTATIVVNGNTLSGQQGPGSPYVTDTSFGTADSITAPTTQSAT